MPYPNYYDPIIDEALSLAGMNRGQYNTLTQGNQQASQYSPFSTNAAYGPGNPKPVGRAEQLNAASVGRRNEYQSAINGISPYFQQAFQRNQIRQGEDARKYQRDYRAKINPANNRMAQTIPGTGARITGQPTMSGAGSSGGGSYASLSSPGISDPVTQSFSILARPIF